MASVSRHRGTEVISYPPTTQGLNPADDASTTYDASGSRIHTVGDIDLSAIEQEMLEDERNTDRIFEPAGLMQRSLRNVEQPIPCYLTGKGEVTADATQASVTKLSALFGRAWGGVKRGNSTTLAGGGHTTTVINLTSTTNLEVGMGIGLINALDTRSLVEIRRITAIAALAVTVDRAFTFTPADADKVVATITVFPDQDVLEDSGSAALITENLFIRKGGASGRVLELLGGKAAIAFSGLNRSELALLTQNFRFATYRTAADDGTGDVSAISPTPAFSGTLLGFAPLQIGRDLNVYLDDVGATTIVCQHVSNFEFDPGISFVPIETSTTCIDNLEGMAGWTIERPTPNASMQITPHTTAFETDLQAGTFKNLLYERSAPEGFAFALMMPHAEVNTTPKLGLNDEVLAEDITLKAHEDLDSVGTTDVAKAPFLLVMA